ncbi:hypothetical protein [Verrucosispora sioxanthis]|uniref:hypothetical protein n=1 Tax=Verrucosispora sioxanthis TaxID=2499994 RepID=UPI001C117EB2|nr:hypothetical protein [Verrucosispora sioxanthis]
MRFALRRARATRGLLLAAAGAALVATVALTGLAAYNRDVVDSGTRNVLAAATAEERSVLVRASAGRTDAALRDLDGALRQRVEADLAGLRPGSAPPGTRLVGSCAVTPVRLSPTAAESPTRR